VKSHKSPVTLLTGGTGFLGSHIGAALLRKGEKVLFLIRRNQRMSAAERLRNILEWHGVDPSQRAGSYLVEGELGKSAMEIDRPEMPRIDRIIHCASDTSFAERNRSRVWAVNVESLNSLLDFAISHRIRTFIDVSTAYAAGRRSSPCPEEPPGNCGFFNVYEESKAGAERLLLRRCRTEGIRLTILRPSIVYGHSRTGRTFRFNALYYPVKTALFLRKIFIEDIKERGGEKAAEMGVTLETDGTTLLPLRIEVTDNGGVNLIPVDFFVEAFFAVVDASLDGGIYHIVNPRQTKIEDIIRYAQSQFKLKGIRPCGPEDFRRTPRNSLEELFERYLGAYSPYMKDTRTFLTEKTDRILKSCGIDCPQFDEAMFRRCMSYAANNDWSSLIV
jgi:nucleoside-diphosphate-sugar epimerase